MNKAIIDYPALRKQIGIEILKRFNYNKNAIRLLQERNIRTCSTGKNIFYLPNKQAVIKQMEQEGLTVYAVIQNVTRTTSYLYVSNKDVDQYLKNMEQNIDPLTDIIDGNQVNAKNYGFNTEYHPIGIMQTGIGYLIRVY